MCGCATVVVQPTDLTPVLNRIDALEALMATTQAQVLATLAEVQALATETHDDVLRVIDKLDAAIAEADLTAVASAAEELRATVQGTDDAAEAAAPEPTDEPAPVEG
jgi:hypothetical protein